MVGSADWSLFLGVLTYMVALVFAGYYYFKYKKIFLLFFITSIATYIFAVFYTWDVFELDKNWILAMLVVSTFVMFFLGKYFSTIELLPADMHTSLKEHKESGKKKNK